jgi:hypothetical protein
VRTVNVRVPAWTIWFRWAPILGALLLSVPAGSAAEVVQIEITPEQATVFVQQCSQFLLKVTPAQPTRVDITVQYSDFSRVIYSETQIPIYPPGDQQNLQVCGRIAGDDPITLTAVLPESLGGATASAVAAVINPVPQPWNMWPTSARAGSGPLDIIFGNGVPLSLSSDSQVLWNGVPKPTVFEIYHVCQVGCPSWIRATIPASDLAVPGSAIVTVVNPPPGGGESRPFSFAIVPGPTDGSIPTVSSEGLIAFGLALAAIGVLALRKP